MRSLPQLIQTAEEVADLYGSLRRFSLDYIELRSQMGVKESVFQALQNQNLLDRFLSREIA